MEIVGLTSQNDLIKYNIKYPCKEICKSFDIKFNQNLSIQSISKLVIKPKIYNWKYVNSATGIKIFLSGYFKIKVFFKQYDSDSLYITKIKKTYSDIIPISNVNINSTKPSLFLEDVIAYVQDSKKISLSLLVLSCITSKTENSNTKDNINSLDYTLPNINCNLPNENLNCIDNNYDFKQMKPSSINIDFDMNSKKQSIIK